MWCRYNRSITCCIETESICKGDVCALSFSQPTSYMPLTGTHGPLGILKYVPGSIYGNDLGVLRYEMIKSLTCPEVQQRNDDKEWRAQDGADIGKHS